MPPARPFFEASSGALDVEQLVAEAYPLAKLIGLVAIVALVPVLLQLLLVDFVGVTPALHLVLGLATQFVLAVGAGLVLLYVVSRAQQLPRA
ncbi:hypothetical protein ACKVMT_01310 [Halobacteriales archaeon Cl-PHB]